MRALSTLALLLLCFAVAATSSSGQGPERSTTPDTEPGTIIGQVTDSEMGTGVAWVDVHDLDGHLEFTDSEGKYRVDGLKPGLHVIEFTRIGYEKQVHEVDIGAGETVELDIRMTAAPIRVDEYLSHGHHVHPEIIERDRSVELSGRDLQRRMTDTVAGTLAREPGLAERTMGPAPARPVVRGMSGERLLVLEDGAPTGDLSATSSDHAVVIDPLSAKEIEIVRGPAALAFGSSVVGGVVNVERGYVPSQQLDRVRGQLQLQGESATRSRATQMRLTGPWKDYVAAVDLSLRRAEDVETPVGEIRNTGITSWNGTVGLSRFQSWGYLGVSASYFDSEYGVPGGFLGGHPNGANLEVDRRHYTLDGEFHPDWDGVEGINLKSGYSRYFQKELESSGACGVSFGVLNYASSLRVHLDDEAPGWLGSGSVGVSYQHRDYASGCLSFTPPVIERSAGVFLYQYREIGDWGLGGSVRFDYRGVEPAYTDTNKAGPIRDRDFAGASASVSVSRDLAEAWTAEAVLSRSFRSPALEELFSDGPHLAAFSFEVGNSDLDTEAGLSAEATMRFESENTALEATAYINQIDGYIQATDTGEIEYGPGEDGFLALWRFVGVDARFIGAEASAAWQRGDVELSASLGYVRAENTSSGGPLPLIPPLSGQVSLDYGWQAFHFGADVRGAARQERLGEFETPTAAYLVPGLRAEWQHLGATILHSVIVRLENVTDAEYRNHLSRIKSILPEEGRNLSVFYRLNF